MTKPNKIDTIMITPDGTLINNTLSTPGVINILTPNGFSYSIDKVIEILAAHEHKNNKIKQVKFAKIKRFKSAFKSALKEALNEPPQV